MSRLNVCRKMQFLWPTAIVLLAAGGFFASRTPGSPETDLAAPGAALYETAVKESVIGLMPKTKPQSPGTAPAHSRQPAVTPVAERPPSPGPDYYWCEHCKTYHKRPDRAAAQQPAAPKPVAARDSQQIKVRVPPSPGPDYYWCTKCQAYHKKQTIPRHTAATNFLGGVTNITLQPPLPIKPTDAGR